MYNIDKKQFGAFVAARRKEKGYTQKDLAEKLYVSDKAVSKWETGASIPDTALLVPLAELLGVTVTELLLCRNNDGKNLTPDEAEKAVKTAIGFDQPDIKRVWQTDRVVPFLYVLALGFAAVGSLVLVKQGLYEEPYLTYMGILALFDGYFCLFAKQRLADIYDQARISVISDGIFRMNLVGVHFNNRNWPHILRVGQIWGIACLILSPWVQLVLLRIGMPTSMLFALCLIVILGGLFIPMYIAGKKYE